MTLPKSTLPYLVKLKKNNNREWFTNNKSVFEKEKALAKDWFLQIEQHINTFDLIEKTKIFRIYRDVRFSKDKTPYKTHFSANYIRSGESRRGSYYLHIEPNNKSFVASGFYQPEKDDLLRVRKEFELDDTAIRKILSNKKLKTYFPNGLQGEELKTAPRDFDKTHHAIDLIRKKSFYFSQNFSDKAILDDSFMETILQSYQATIPYLDYMTELLTTNLNGESIL